MQIAYRGCISPDHPAVPGHFPGHPIVPGVVLLTETLRAIESRFGPGVKVTELPIVKFTAPLRPGETFTITVEALEQRQLKFTVACGAMRIASGTMRYIGDVPRQE